ncbi:M50 family metallopeptidase, partial [Patescibacteria group bacterium]|nr:M50 family metallopeptidase [Patescibacteria group bacterium]
MAKKFGVKVEEFGIGYPPRLFGRKFGETIYSINLLPFGAFVKIYGQEERIDDPRSFTRKPFWQKALIILGGVISFWVVSAILLSIVMAIGVPTVVEDEENHNLVNPKVQITAISPVSPAQEAGLKIGDTIIELKFEEEQLKIDKVSQVQEFTQAHKGGEVTLAIKRGKDIFDVSLIPRTSPPENEGPMGIALVRTVLRAYPWYQAPIKGVIATGNLTLRLLEGWGMVITSLFQGKGMPSG